MQGLMPAPDLFFSKPITRSGENGKQRLFGHILTINWHHFLKKRPFGADIYLILTWLTSLTVKEGKNNRIWNKFAASSPKTVSCDDQNSGFRPKSGSVQQLSICFHDRYRLENGTVGLKFTQNGHTVHLKQILVYFTQFEGNFGKMKWHSIWKRPGWNPKILKKCIFFMKTPFKLFKSLTVGILWSFSTTINHFKGNLYV